VGWINSSELVGLGIGLVLGLNVGQAKIEFSLS
jgi:hypothetical protein